MPKGTVLITGVSGFIANHRAVDLLDAGYDLRGTVRSLARSDKVREVIGKHADASRLDFVEADLESVRGWGDAVAGCTHVLHVASPFPATPLAHWAHRKRAIAGYYVFMSPGRRT